MLRARFQRLPVNWYDTDWTLVFQISPQVILILKNSEEPEILLYLLAKNLVCHNFKDAGIKHEIP